MFFERYWFDGVTETVEQATQLLAKVESAGCAHKTATGTGALNLDAGHIAAAQ